MNKKVIAVIVLILAIIVGYNIFFSEAAFEKQIKENLPYNLVNYKIEHFGYYEDLLLEEEKEDYNKYTLEVKDLTIEKYVKNGNFAEVDCIIVLEDENIKKTMDVTLYCTKYNNGWQADDWTENEPAIIIPKFAPYEFQIDKAIKRDFLGLTILSETEDYSSGFFKRTYSVNDEYKYVTFTGEIVVDAEFIELDGEELYRYYWYCKAEYNTKANWNVLGTWKLEYSFSNNTPKKTMIININDVYGEDGISGDATGYYPLHDGIKYTGEYGTKYDDSLYCSEKIDTAPESAKLSILSSCGNIEFTKDTCTGYVDVSGNKANNITRE